MLKVGHRTLIFLSGLVWLVIGIFLLSLGFRFLLETLSDPLTMFHEARFSLMSKVAPYMSDLKQAIIVTITTAFIVGYLKGKFVLRKAVLRQVRRILSFPEQTSIHRLYGIGTYFLIIGMISLGISLRFLPISLDTRGLVDLAIGAALISGSFQYFRFATTSYQSLIKQTPFSP